MHDIYLMLFCVRICARVHNFLYYYFLLSRFLAYSRHQARLYAREASSGHRTRDLIPIRAILNLINFNYAINFFIRGGGGGGEPLSTDNF